ncbi:MAG: hypothetical protein ACOCWG_04965 [bacterium]
MSLLGIIFIVIIALLIGLLFYYVFKTTGPWSSFWTFFLVLLLAGLTASLWVEPIGPSYYDVAFIPLTFIILLFAILLAAASPTYNRVAKKDASSQSHPRPSNSASATGAALGIFFWILLVFFLIAIIAGFWSI